MIKFERKSIAELSNQYSVGRRQKRAILKNGDEVTVLNKKYKHLANNICDFLNGSHIKCQQIEFNMEQQRLVTSIRYHMLCVMAKRQEKIDDPNQPWNFRK